MAIKRPKPEEIVVKLRQVEVLMGQRPPTSSRDHPGRTDIAKASTGECATSC